MKDKKRFDWRILYWSFFSQRYICTIHTRTLAAQLSKFRHRGAKAVSDQGIIVKQRLRVRVEDSILSKKHKYGSLRSQSMQNVPPQTWLRTVVNIPDRHRSSRSKVVEMLFLRLELFVDYMILVPCPYKGSDHNQGRALFSDRFINSNTYQVMHFEQYTCDCIEGTTYQISPSYEL